MQKNNYIATISMAFLFLTAIVFQLYKSFKWGHDSWQMTEWLINYSGGFVRRGLSGELFYWLAKITEIQAIYFVIFFSLVVYLVLLFYFLIQAKGVFPVYLILSPVLLGSAAYQDFIIRKDALGILLLIFCLSVSERKWTEFTRLFFMNVIAVTAILLHESFLFFGLPVLVLVNANPRNDHSVGELKTLLVTTLKFSSSIAAFGLAVAFHGNTTIANSINYSWRDLWVYIEPSGCCFNKPSAAIDSLQWSTSQGLALSASVLHEFSMGVYVPFAWIITIFLCFYFMVNSIGSPSKYGNGEEDSQALFLHKRRLAKIMIFQFVFVSPLFVFGWDFGRWIFLWTSSSLAVYLTEIDLNFSIFRYIDKTSDFLLRLINKFAQPKPWYLLFFGIPSCCWTVNGFIFSSPAGFFAKAMAKAVMK